MMLGGWSKASCMYVLLYGTRPIAVFHSLRGIYIKANVNFKLTLKNKEFLKDKGLLHLF